MAIAKALEPKERAAARERKAHDGRPGKLPERRTGDTPDKVAAHTIQNRCAEIKLRAERRAGEVLAETEKHPAGRPARNRLHDATNSPQLADLGITKMQSHRWQAVAAGRSRFLSSCRFSTRFCLLLPVFLDHCRLSPPDDLPTCTGCR